MPRKILAAVNDAPNEQDGHALAVAVAAFTGAEILTTSVTQDLTGASATACTLTFGTPYSTIIPTCTVTPYGGVALPSLSISTAALTFGAGTAASARYDVHCWGAF